jgi:D-glycerate 3-kinase
MLKTPSFDCVCQWRLEQKEKLREESQGVLAESNKLMSPEKVANFIQYYQCIAESNLQYLPNKADHLFHLDEQRHVTAYQHQTGKE